MTFSYDVNDLDDVNKVRLLISDTVNAGHIFENEEITGLIAMEGVVPLAAARALEIMAANETMVQKRIKTLELSTDGPAEATALLAIAERFRKTWEDSVDAAEADFEVVSLGVDQFTRNQIWWNEWAPQFGLEFGLN